jgi:phosphonate transport system ATP-binding protein
MFSVNGAGKVYGSLAALVPVDLTITAGECVALMGPSGSGKSTLLGLLAAALRPDSGSVLIDGKNAASMRPGRELSRLVGVMPQGFDLVPSLAVVHNVLAGNLGVWSLPRSLVSLLAPRNPEQARDALDRVGIAEKLYERTSRLSGGEKQRVALARLLVQNPQAILADEPVSSVDPARADDILAMLMGVAGDGGKTIVASMHAAPLALKYFERVIGLRRGRVVLDCRTQQVTASDLDALYDLSLDEPALARGAA